MGCEGPNAYDCWGLVRAVFREHYQIEIPSIAANQTREENVFAIKNIADGQGWRLLAKDATLQDADVALMVGVYGRHVGIVVSANRGTLGVLHANGGLNAKGAPFGSVAYQPIPDMIREGYYNFEFWRRRVEA